MNMKPIISVRRDLSHLPPVHEIGEATLVADRFSYRPMTWQ